MSLESSFMNDKEEKVSFVPEETTSSVDDKSEFMTVENIARLGWAAHREWEKILGELPKPEWDDLPEDRRNELHDSVAWILNHSAASIAQQHDAWRAVRATQGWTYGKEYNGALKTEPNLVKFDDLPWSQQRKAWIWRHIVHAICG